MSVNKNNIRHSKNYSQSNLNESSSNSNSKIADIQEKYHVPFGMVSVNQNQALPNSIIQNIKKAIISNSLISYPSNHQKKPSINGKNSPERLNISGNDAKMQNQTVQQYFSTSSMTSSVATGSKKISRKESNGSMSEDGIPLSQIFSRQISQVQQKNQQNENSINGRDDLVEQIQNDQAQTVSSSNLQNQILGKQSVNVQSPQVKLYSQMYEQMKQNRNFTSSNSRIGNNSEDMISKYQSVNKSQSSISPQGNRQIQQNVFKNNPNGQSLENQYQKIAILTKQYHSQQQKNSSSSPENKKLLQPMISFNYQNVVAANQKNIKQFQQQNSLQQQSIQGSDGRLHNPQIQQKIQTVNQSQLLKKQQNELQRNNQNSNTESSINCVGQQYSPVKNLRNCAQRGTTGIGESKSTKHSQNASKEHSNQLFQITRNPQSQNSIEGRVYSQTPSNIKQAFLFNSFQNCILDASSQEKNTLVTSNSQTDLINLNSNQHLQIAENNNSPLIKQIGSNQQKKNKNSNTPQQNHQFHRQTYSLSNIKQIQQFQPHLNQSQQKLILQQNTDLEQYSKEPSRNVTSAISKNQQIKRNISNEKQTLNLSVTNPSAAVNSYYLTNNNYLSNLNHTYSNLMNNSTTNASHSRRQGSSHLKQNTKNTTNMKTEELLHEKIKQMQIPTSGEYIKNQNSFVNGTQSPSPSKKEGKVIQLNNTNIIQSIVTGQSSKENKDEMINRKSVILNDLKNHWQKLSFQQNNSDNNHKNSYSSIQEESEYESKNIQSSQLTNRKYVSYQNGLKQITEYEPSLKQIINYIISFNNMYISQVPNIIKENQQLKVCLQNQNNEISELKKKVSLGESVAGKLKKNLDKCEQQLANYTTQSSLNQEQLIVFSGEKSPTKVQQNQQLIFENQNLQNIVIQQQNEIEQYKERENQFRDLLIEFNKKGLIKINANGDAQICSPRNNPESEGNQSGNREEYRQYKKNLKELLLEQKGNNSINDNQLADDSRISESQESSFGFIGKVTLQDIGTQQEFENQLITESPQNKSPKKVDDNLREKLKINIAQVQETQKLIIEQQAIQEQNEKEIQIQQQLLKQQDGQINQFQQNQMKQQKSNEGKLKTQKIMLQNQFINSPQQIQIKQQQIQNQQIQIQKQQILQQQQQNIKQQQLQQQSQIQPQQQLSNIQQQLLNPQKIAHQPIENCSSDSSYSEDIYYKDLTHFENINQNKILQSKDEKMEQIFSSQQHQQKLHEQQQTYKLLQNYQQQQQLQKIAQQQSSQQQMNQEQENSEHQNSSEKGVLMPKPVMKKLQLNNINSSVSPPKSTIIDKGTMSVGGFNKPNISKIEIEKSNGIGFHDEFMSRLNEFSLSWRKAAEKERKPHTQY